MLNVLSDVASAGDTVLCVWAWGPSTLDGVLSNIPLFGTHSGPPGPAAQATGMVESAVQGATGLEGAEPATAYASASAAYIGMSLTVNSDGDGVPYNNLLSPIASLGGIFTAGTGPILAFVDYGNAGESSGPLAQQASTHDDAGSYGGGLVPKAAITGIQDAIDSLGPETPYFQGVWGVSAGGVARVTTSSGFSSQIGQQGTINQGVGATAATAQKAAQTVKDAATGVGIGITGILIALIVVEVFLAKA
jgi:hypothetical protein